MKASTSLRGREKGKSHTGRRARSLFEPLETRLMFSQLNYEVTTVADSGQGSLRAAIVAANAQPGFNNIINFNIPGAGVQTIVPLTPLPVVTSETSIQAPTDASGNPLIQLDGQSAGSFSSGLIFDRSTPGNDQSEVVSGLAINRFAFDGVVIAGQGDVELFGCRIGTDATGTVASPNKRDGLRIYSPNNFIGLPYAGGAFMNVIDANGEHGISIFGNGLGNCVRNNYIGISADGNHALGNRLDGVWLDTTGTTIGGVNPMEGNVISGNPNEGIEISTSYGGPNAAGPNQIFGNRIGTNSAGTASVPNGNGIFIMAGAGTQIGNSTAGSRNLISGNAQYGIASDVGISIVNDYIGTDITGTKAVGSQITNITIGPGYSPAVRYGAVINSCVISGSGAYAIAIQDCTNTTITNDAIGTNAKRTAAIATYGNGIGVTACTGTTIKNDTIANIKKTNYYTGTGIAVTYSGSGTTIEANSIYAIDGLGIQLGYQSTPLANDLGDIDTGPNGLQNYAVLTSAVAGSTGTVVKGTFNGAANTKFRVDFYFNSTIPTSGYGQGQKFLGIVTFTTNASGNATFTVTLPKVGVGQFISSTATDAAGNTSEFSKDIKMT